MDLASLKRALVGAGCVRLFAKTLSPNDNSKNQVYLSGNVETLHMFRPTEIVSGNLASTGPTFKGKLVFGWLQDSGVVAPAPRTQIILYSQYPEVRLSGFLAGCASAPSCLMTSRAAGRILFLGITKDSDVVAYVAEPDSILAREYSLEVSSEPTSGVLVELRLGDEADEESSRRRLLSTLKTINAKGWIDSKQLDSRGGVQPCHAPQCGGYTLEAELGVSKNSRAEADYEGWEVKSYAVRSFERPLSAGPITLFTPEPTGGAYRDLGFDDFMRRYGYVDRRGREDRINFGGTYFVGRSHPTTHLGLRLSGFDASKGKVVNALGAIELTAANGEVAASWSFSSILEHWNRKHRFAAYVPNQKRTSPTLSYAYGHRVHLAQHTDHERLLSAFASGFVYYDPGIKLEAASTTTPRAKKRSQFRVKARHLYVLYKAMEQVDLR